MDIIFLNSKTGEQLTMPVTPSEFRVEIGRAVTQLDMAQTGQVNLPGLEALFNEQQTFLLPSSARNYTSAGYGGDPYGIVDIATYNSTQGLRELYGLMQQAIRASDKEDPAQSARQILEENGITTTITAKCLGNTKLITGNAVVVHEPVTGTDGLFWILSDSHTTVNGIYQTTVTLDFRNLMDKQEAGSVPTE